MMEVKIQEMMRERMISKEETINMGNLRGRILMRGKMIQDTVDIKGGTQMSKWIGDSRIMYTRHLNHRIEMTTLCGMM